MTAQDPLHVEFDVDSEALAHTLDILIHRHGGDPNRWFNAMLRERQLDNAAAAAHRLRELGELVAASVGAGDGTIPPKGSPEDLAFEAELAKLGGPEISDWRKR